MASLQANLRAQGSQLEQHGRDQAALGAQLQAAREGMQAQETAATAAADHASRALKALQGRLASQEAASRALADQHAQQAAAWQQDQAAAAEQVRGPGTVCATCLPAAPDTAP